VGAGVAGLLVTAGLVVTAGSVRTVWLGTVEGGGVLSASLAGVDSTDAGGGVCGSGVGSGVLAVTTLSFDGTPAHSGVGGSTPYPRTASREVIRTCLPIRESGEPGDTDT
jgi:hypothetical protein